MAEVVLEWREDKLYKDGRLFAWLSKPEFGSHWYLCDGFFRSTHPTREDAAMRAEELAGRAK